MPAPFFHRFTFALLTFSLFSVGWLRGELSPKFQKELVAGDQSAFNTVAQSTSLDDLYNVLMLALTNQFGTHSNEVRELAITSIRHIPDHAKQLGDKIEELSSRPGTGRNRERAFYLLQNIASPEAVTQIGRFLLDERNPENGLPINDGSFEMPNSHWAANAMGAAMGDRIGLKRKPGFYGLAEVKAWQTWWQSPAGDSFRASAVTPAVRPNVKSAVPMKTEEAKPAAHSQNTTPSRWPLWTAMIIAAIGLLWLLLKNRK